MPINSAKDRQQTASLIGSVAIVKPSGGLDTGSAASATTSAAKIASWIMVIEIKGLFEVKDREVKEFRGIGGHQPTRQRNASPR